MPAHPGAAPCGREHRARRHRADPCYHYHCRFVLGEWTSACALRVERVLHRRDRCRHPLAEEIIGGSAGIQRHARRTPKGPNMFSSSQIKYLHAHKQDLLVQSEAQRRLLARECAHVQQRLQWMDSVATTARHVLPWCGMVWPLWRLWTARRKSTRESSCCASAAAVSIARRLTQAWKLFGRGSDNQSSKASDKIG